MATDKPRFSLTMDDSLLNQVENYQIKHGFSTKSRAIQALVKAGLDDILQAEPTPEIEKSPSLEDGDEELLKKYHQLSQYNRGRVSGYIDMLLEEAKSQEDSGCVAG